MIPVDQTTTHKGYGDCERAVIASLLEVDIHAVPHFILFGQFGVYLMRKFMHSCGWELEGFRDRKIPLDTTESINGYFYASVKSRTHENGFHAVVIDANGVVVHDPNPNKLWQGANVHETGYNGWYAFRPRHDEEWESWVRVFERKRLAANGESATHQRVADIAAKAAYNQHLQMGGGRGVLGTVLPSWEETDDGVKDVWRRATESVWKRSE